MQTTNLLHSFPPREVERHVVRVIPHSDLFERCARKLTKKTLNFVKGSVNGHTYLNV